MGDFGITHPLPWAEVRLNPESKIDNSQSKIGNPKSKIRLIVGLGNPGTEYSGTRHNLGFDALDELARREKLTWSASPKHECQTAAWDVAPDQKVLLAKPQTYMNLSGRSVSSLCKYLKIAPQEMLVVCDDCEIPLGEIRIRAQGGPGGHNGLASLIEHLQTEDFPRVRLGIGPADPLVDLSDFVLGRFRPEERETIENLTSRAVSAMTTSLSFSLERAMNQFNRKQSNS